MNNLGRTSISNISKENEFEVLKQELVEKYGLTYDFLTQMENSYAVDMQFNKITAQSVIYEIEASLISRSSEINKIQMKDIVSKSIESLLQKAAKQKKKPNVKISKDNKANDFLINEDKGGIIKELQFELFVSFNNESLNISRVLNSSDINYTFLSNLEIIEYDIIPKDEDSYYEEYLKYFEEYKKNLLISRGIEVDNPLLDVDKFVFLVTFNNFEGKPLMSDIVLVNPSKNFKQFSLKMENDILKDFNFFNGQIIYIEGYAKGNEIYAQKIIFGFSLITYALSDSYVKGFFHETNPFLIYAINGPFMNKKNVDLTVLKKTLNYIANENPHALILNGPILNVDNEMIASGEINFGNKESSTNYFELFEMILSEILRIFQVKLFKLRIKEQLSYYVLL
jgi:hypothetical protein